MREQVFGPSGYFADLSLPAENISRLRSMISDHWRSHLKSVAPKHACHFEQLEMDRYHEKSDLLDHHAIWPKEARILSLENVKEIRQMSFFEELESDFGTFEISDENDVGREEIYWRIVRPNEGQDMGPLHADAWFWELGHGYTPDNVKRVKIWIGIYVEPGASGFRYSPGTHLKEWPYHGIKKDGIMKPVIETPDEELNPITFMGESGDAILFHDLLIHGGAPSVGGKTRVSMEFTMFVKP